MPWYRREDNILILSLHVQPGARRSEVAGIHGESLKIRLAAPPVEGRANKALLHFMAGLFAVPVRQVELLRGDQSRQKTVRITGSSVLPEQLIE